MLDPDFIHKVNEQECALESIKQLMDKFSSIAIPNTIQYMKLKQDIAEILDGLYAPQ